jgi:[acyl-carrier-protein] S-malonyltransferase
MGKLAFVFSGQGAQYPGMGLELFQNNQGAEKVFAQAEILRPGTQAQCFSGSKAELGQTVNTQPCLFCVDLAAAYSLQALGVSPDLVAGFSLGELAALAFAQAFDFKTGFALICRRAELMAAVAEQQPGAMVAVLKLERGVVEELCAQFEQAYPVNYNSASQTVVAIENASLSDFTQAVQRAGGKALSLAVSGAFHSPFMQEAQKGLQTVLAEVPMQTPLLPVYANLTALPYAETIKETLAAQVASPVLWQQTIENMVAAGVDTFIEVGPGKTLMNLIKKIDPSVQAFNVENNQSLKLTLDACRQLGYIGRPIC